MKKDIHPKYEEITANCSCGNVIKIRSTVGHDLNLDVCSKCHPFYTGKQRDVATGGRVDRFKQAFQHPRQQVSSAVRKKRLMALFLYLRLKTKIYIDVLNSVFI